VNLGANDLVRAFVVWRFDNRRACGMTANANSAARIRTLAGCDDVVNQLAGIAILDNPVARVSFRPVHRAAQITTKWQILACSRQPNDFASIVTDAT